MKMNTRAISSLILLMCVSAQVCLAAAKSPIASGRASVIFPEWGISAEIPPPFKRLPIDPGGNTLYAEIFICGDYAYTVEVINTPHSSLSPTYIEQTIQTDIKSASPGSAKRWELNSRKGELFKGVTKPFQFMFAYPNDLYLLLGRKDGVCSVAMAAMKGKSAPVLRIGVISKKENLIDVETKAKSLAASLVFMPIVPSLKPVAVHGVVPKSKANSYSMWPVRILSKGEIQLTGVVETVGSGTLVMSVSEVRMPNGKPIKLTPARSKAVLLKSMPKGIVVGANVRVVGKNSGVGKPINADICWYRLIKA